MLDSVPVGAMLRNVLTTIIIAAMLLITVLAVAAWQVSVADRNARAAMAQRIDALVQAEGLSVSVLSEQNGETLVAVTPREESQK